MKSKIFYIALIFGITMTVSSVSATSFQGQAMDTVHSFTDQVTTSANAIYTTSNNINNINNEDPTAIPGNNYYMTDDGDVYKQVSEHIYYNEDTRIIDSIPIEHEPYMVRYNNMEFTF